MIQYRKILELHLKGVTQRTICSSLGHSRQTVSEVIIAFKKSNLLELTEEMNDIWLEEYFFPEKQAVAKGFLPIDFEQIHKELQKKNITLKLLHNEYSYLARTNKKIPYAYRSFCRLYNDYARKHKATMPLKRKPGELMEVDWAGKTLSIQDPASGEELKVYIFIASLPYSQYFYVEGFLDMKSESWLKAHINAFEYFQGVAEALVPDNLKTGITKPDTINPIINRSYRELADYYSTTIVPARVRKPKDKPSVEGNVGFVSRQILASLRNYQCFSLNKLNEKILELTNELNALEFQKRAGSRKTIFEEEEQEKLIPLPVSRYQLSEWKTAKVQSNYHIQVNRMYYSVPHDYIQCQVDVRKSQDLIEVYFKDLRIASHKVLSGDVGQYSTNPDHMPDKHRLYLEHTPEKMRQWAKIRGSCTDQFVNYILDNNVEKKALNILSSLRSLDKKYGGELLEKGCQVLLEISQAPSLSVLKTIIKGLEQKSDLNSQINKTESIVDNNHGFVRGAKYFGGLKDAE